MLYHLSFFIDIGFAIVQALRTLIAKIAATLYNYIVKLYDVFMIIARANFLEDKYVQLIYNRVGIILGLFMLFKLSFSLIQSLIDPDKFNDKKNGFKNIIVRSIFAIVLLGVTPAIFKYAREFQNLVVGSRNDSNNVIYRIIVAEDSIQTSNSSFGRRLATDLFFSFFKEKNGMRFHGDVKVVDLDGNYEVRYEDYEYLKESYLKEDKDFGDLVKYMSLYEGGDYVFDWDIILSVGVAIAVLWILINYCISVATRVIQLAYLQLVSPIPILSYIGDPEGSFKKWVKQCTSTYLDLFIRLAILYFIITLAGKFLAIISDGMEMATFGVKEGTLEYTLVKVFILIGLLMFGKRVPELLKELFPGNGTFDLGIKSPKNLLGSIPGGKLAFGAAKLGYGAATGVALGAAGRVVGGLAHGAVNMKKAWVQNKGAGWKRGLKTLGFGMGGLGASVLGGVAGGIGGGYRNRKGGFISGVKGGWGALNAPIKGDVESWKKHYGDRHGAKLEEKERERFITYGESLYKKYHTGTGDDWGDDITIKAYSTEYGKTYKDKKDAEKAVIAASVAERSAQSALNAAYARGADNNEIKTYERELNDAAAAHEKSKKDFERAAAAHKRSQQTHKNDYMREQAFGAFRKSVDLEEYNTKRLATEARKKNGRSSSETETPSASPAPRGERTEEYSPQTEMEMTSDGKQVPRPYPADSDVSPVSDLAKMNQPRAVSEQPEARPTVSEATSEMTIDDYLKKIGKPHGVDDDDEDELISSIASAFSVDKKEAGQRYKEWRSRNKS